MEQLNFQSRWSRICRNRICNMRNNFKNANGLLFFFFVRRLERVLPVRGLYLLLGAYAFVRAAWHGVFRRRPAPVIVPDWFGTKKTVQAGRLHRLNLYMNRTMELFPDRMAERKWMNRCHFTGLEHLRAARQNGRPVVLAFCHFGPFVLLRYWLRAAGIPVAALIMGEAGNRSDLKRLTDQISPFAEIPTAFYMDQLREAVEFLAAENVLLIALDHSSGKLLNVPLRAGWTFKMASGAVRLAIRYQAELIPVCIIDEGDWNFRIELGRPVPGELLATETNWIQAGKYLMNEMFRHFQNHPEQCAKIFRHLEKTPPSDFHM
jgi:lauroyl/myristoyl acyltransferase